MKVARTDQKHSCGERGGPYIESVQVRSVDMSLLEDHTLALYKLMHGFVEKVQLLEERSEQAKVD